MSAQPPPRSASLGSAARRPHLAGGSQTSLGRTLSSRMDASSSSQGSSPHTHAHAGHAAQARSQVQSYSSYSTSRYDAVPSRGQAGHRRAFVDKLSDQTAAEAREGAKHEVLQDQSWTWPTLLNHEVPNFYELAIAGTKHARIDRGDDPSLCKVPWDSSYITQVPAKHRTANASVPKSILSVLPSWPPSTQSQSLSQSLEDPSAQIAEDMLFCTKHFIEDWSVFQTPHATITQGPAPPRDTLLEQIGTLEYHCDSDGPRPASSVSTSSRVSTASTGSAISAVEVVKESESLHTEMLNYVRDHRGAHKEQRKENRKPILFAANSDGACTLSDVPDNGPSLLQGLPDEQLMQRRFGHRIHMGVLSLKTFTSEPAFEPLFVRIFLFHAERKERLSETFLVVPDLNGMMQNLIPDREDFDAMQQSSNPPLQALFSLQEIDWKVDLPHIFIVIRVDRLLHGDSGPALDYYSKSHMDPKARDKVIRSLEQHKNLSRFSTPFAVGSFPVSDVLVCAKGYSCTCYRHRRVIDLVPLTRDKLKADEFAKLLRQDAETRKRKRLNIELEIKANLLRDEDIVPAIITSAFKRVEPYDDQAETIAMEMEEFPLLPLTQPHREYMHSLFVYPVAVNLGCIGEKSFCCRVQLLSSNPSSTGAEILEHDVVYGLNGYPVVSQHCPVLYHCRHPYMQFEVKVRLPEILDSTHHLLFTFLQVSCKDTKSRSPEKPVAFAWLRLNQSPTSTIESKPYQLPLAAELPPHYYKSPLDSKRGIKLLDGGRPLFTLQLRLMSSVSSPSSYLKKFFTKAKHFVPNPNVPQDIIESIGQAIYNVNLAIKEDTHNVVYQFYPAILRCLFAAVAAFSNESRFNVIVEEAFALICIIVSEVQKGKTANHKADELVTFLRYSLNTQLHFPGQIVANCIATQFLRVVSEPEKKMAKMVETRRVIYQTVANTCITRAWFFFEAMSKSLAQYVEVRGLSKSAPAQRFPPQAYGLICQILDELSLRVSNGEVVPSQRAQELCYSFGFFLRDLLSICDVTEIFKASSLVIKNLHKSPHINISLGKGTLASFRLDVLRILCSHENYVQLNLPSLTVDQRLDAVSVVDTVETQVNPSQSRASVSTATIAEEATVEGVGACDAPWCHLSQGHFLVHTLIAEMFFVLNTEDEEQRLAAIKLVYDKLLNHANDPRLQGPNQQAVVARLYFPVIIGLLSYKPLLAKLDSFHAERHQDEYGDSKIQREPVGYNSKHIDLTSRELRSLLVLATHILSTVDMLVIKTWWKSNHVQANNLAVLCDFVKLLGFTNTVLAYKGKREVMSQTQAHSPMQMRKVQMLHRHQSTAVSSMTADDVAALSRSTSSASASPQMPRTSTGTAKPQQRDSHLTPHRLPSSISAVIDDSPIELSKRLAHEVALLTLDILEELFVDFEQKLSDYLLEPYGLMLLTFEVLTCLLGNPQSTQVVKCTLHTLQAFLSLFPEVVFGEPDIAAEHASILCELVLRWCNTDVVPVRQRATASLYLLMRSNYRFGDTKGFTRIRVQTTLALSRIISDASKSFTTDEYLRKAWATIIKYAKNDQKGMAADHKGMSKDFRTSVEEMAVQLYGILRDTAQIRAANDTHMEIDIHHRIAEQYKNSPELRMTWYKSLGDKHKREGNHMESGMCYIHSAALVSEYLFHMQDEKEPKGHPVGCNAFISISPNADMEGVSISGSDLREETFAKNTNALEKSLRELLRKAIAEFEAADAYEFANKTYELLCPMFYAQRDFKYLSQLYGKISANYAKIDELGHSKRYFAEYFRVKFFGDLFGPELNRKEFIYREKPLTKLPEVCQRLVALYSNQFGRQNVEAIQDSKEVDEATLDPARAYIQITYVEPFISEQGVDPRKTPFERSVNLNQFVYETPFTKSLEGKARGSIESQWLRRTYLTVPAFFPFMKARQEVVQEKTTTEELTPIQVGTRSMQKKADSLEALLKQPDTNYKLLQLELQGSVVVQVNEGPLEMARVFLSPATSRHYTPQEIKRFQRALKGFKTQCGLALAKFSKRPQAGTSDLDEYLMKEWNKLEAEVTELLESSKALKKKTASMASSASTASSARLSPTPGQKATLYTSTEA
eukprot:m.116931 g.116931  ORF g.116931 m.116931 type:complete len:2092 (+) comp13619_c0_seq1:34-6309(+)